MVETIIVVIVVVGFGTWIYREGKRLGSRKAYGVGLHRGRRR